MTRAVAIVGGISLGIVVMFILFSYLMSTVNPAKISTKKYPAEENDKPESAKPSQTETTKTTVTEPVSVTVTASTDSMVKRELRTFNESRNEEYLVRHFNGSKREGGVVISFDQKIKENNETARIIDRGLNETSPNISAANNLESTEDFNKTNNVTHSTAFRRSVDLELDSKDVDTEDIIFKILDEQGHPSIEIKIVRPHLGRRDRRLNRENGSHNVKSNVSVYETSQPSLKSTMSLLPNNTLFVDEVERKAIPIVAAETKNDVLVNDKLYKKYNAITSA